MHSKRRGRDVERDGMARLRVADLTPVHIGGVYEVTDDNGRRVGFRLAGYEQIPLKEPSGASEWYLITDRGQRVSIANPEETHLYWVPQPAAPERPAAPYAPTTAQPAPGATPQAAPNGWFRTQPQ